MAKASPPPCMQVQLLTFVPCNSINLLVHLKSVAPLCGSFAAFYTDVICLNASVKKEYQSLLERGFFICHIYLL